VPVVEGGELVHQVDQSGDLVLGVVTHDLFVSHLGIKAPVVHQLLLHKAVHGGLQGAAGDGIVAGSVRAVQLHVVTGDRVIRIMFDRVKVLVHAAPLGAAGIAHILGVAEGTIVDNVVQTLALDTTKDVVKTAVLQENPDDILNLVLQVGNGLLGARGVPKGGVAGGSHGRSSSAAGETEQGHQSVGLHNDGS
jgi:hypothetical protein